MKSLSFLTIVSLLFVISPIGAETVTVRPGKSLQEAADKLNVGRIQKVLQSLLRERVSIRDLEGILEAMCDASDRADDPQELTRAVREELGYDKIESTERESLTSAGIQS